ncbi:hypothetical protein PYW07_004572 [Mythimna separata]|uniref:Uncharacterized protein n=1 Tax=Mythimna separata TaxID=271217 RepID=A0AAD7YZE2_MYTSE|nr:hypothetical protein PYW07_004572 [Mythimna separata]
MWGNSTDHNRAFIAQKKCIRAIYGLQPDQSCRPLFKKHCLLPLPALYIYETCMLVKKNEHLFVKADTIIVRNRRDPYRLVLSNIPRLTKYNKSCVTMCVRLYNKLPSDFKSLNVRSFKKKLYDWLSFNNFYSIKDFIEKKY